MKLPPAPRRWSHRPATRRKPTRLGVEPLEERSLLSASIAGIVVEDVTGNGITALDPALAGRWISLYRDNGDSTFQTGSDTLVARQQTNATGRYQFASLAAGTYFVQQDLPSGWKQTAPESDPHDAILPPAQAGTKPPERNDTLATAVATGLSSAQPGKYVTSGDIGDNNRVADALDVDLFRFQLDAGDRVRIDVDAEAFRSPLDAVLRLFDSTGLQVAASFDTVGDSGDPALEFLARTTGTYYVGISGFGNGQYNPAVEGSGGPLPLYTGAYTIEIEVGRNPGAEAVPVVLTANEHRSGVNLASSRLGSISGQMFEDVDGDGVHDPGEPGQDGQLVLLHHQGVITSFVTTRSIDRDGNGTINPATESGWFIFDDLEPGVYFLRGLAAFGLAPPGWVQTTPSFVPAPRTLIGHVTSGPPTDPGVSGLLPDLTVSLPEGLGNWFITGTTLHFGQATPNIGLGPMELRAGADLGNGTQAVLQRIYQNTALTSYIDRQAGTFTFHPEHNHIHFDNYAEFALRAVLPDADGDGIGEVGAVVVEAEKRSFCLVDVAPYDLTLPNADPDGSGFGCGDVQRISVGWQDIYDPLTLGQQIDVSGLPPGQYWLEAVVDPLNRLVESNEANNIGRVLVTIDPSVPTAPVGAHGMQLRTAENVLDRDFGNFRTITISGQVFEDRNGNGTRENNEQGLSGRVVFLDTNGDGILNNPEGNGIASALARERWAITDNQGNFVFSGVGPGSHRVRQVVPAGWTQTTPNPATIEARSGQNVASVRIGTFQGAALMASSLGPGGRGIPLTTAQIQPVLAEALARWQAAGEDVDRLGKIEVRITNLGSTLVGLVTGNTIWLDADAAGWGWFVDPTPWDDSEFTTPGDQGEQERIDLLSVLLHELGHLLGHDHEEVGAMTETLAPGSRLALEDATHDETFLGDWIFALRNRREADGFPL